MTPSRSPRAVRDNALPSLTAHGLTGPSRFRFSVRLLPRTLSVTYDLGIFLTLGLMFAGMAALLAFLPPWRAAGMPIPLLLFIGVIDFGLMLVPLVLLRRLIRTIVASRDQKRGVLRQGILVGPEGLLVRIEPNDCFPVPADRFLGAELRISGGPTDNDHAVEKEYFRIETENGPIEFFSERLADTPKNLNRIVREVRKNR
jgi:hypothetical protein